GAHEADRALADVRSEDLDRALLSAFSQELEQRDGERVGLLAGRAARDPDPQRIGGRLVLDELRENVRLELVEELRITEKRRDVNEHVFEQGLGLARIVAQ